MCDYTRTRRFGFDIRFIDHFYTQLVITLNYSVLADLHIVQITTATANTFAAVA
jgi:hypothetical protein